MNIEMQMSLQDPDFNPCGFIPRSKICGSYGSSIFSFLRNLQENLLFSVMASPMYIPTNTEQGFPFLHILTNIYLLVFDKSILTGVRWYLMVLIWISLMINDVFSTFSYTCWPFVCLFQRNVYSVSLPILKLGYLFSCYWIVGVPYIFWILTLYHM